MSVSFDSSGVRKGNQRRLSLSALPDPPARNGPRNNEQPGKGCWASWAWCFLTTSAGSWWVNSSWIPNPRFYVISLQTLFEHFFFFFQIGTGNWLESDWSWSTDLGVQHMAVVSRLLTAPPFPPSEQMFFSHTPKLSILVLQRIWF